MEISGISESIHAVRYIRNTYADKLL